MTGLADVLWPTATDEAFARFNPTVSETFQTIKTAALAEVGVRTRRGRRDYLGVPSVSVPVAHLAELAKAREVAYRSLGIEFDLLSWDEHRRVQDARCAVADGGAFVQGRTSGTGPVDRDGDLVR